MAKMTLDMARIGDEGIVKAIICGEPVRSRLMAMGFIRGTKIKVVRIAPLGDPMEFEVKGYSVSLRREEAKCIEIEMGDV